MSRHQKGKTNLGFTEASDSEWQVHQLGHTQLIIMHCETLLRLSIEEVNFTSVPKTNIALSVLKAKQLQ